MADPDLIIFGTLKAAMKAFGAYYDGKGSFVVKLPIRVEKEAGLTYCFGKIKIAKDPVNYYAKVTPFKKPSFANESIPWLFTTSEGVEGAGTYLQTQLDHFKQL